MRKLDRMDITNAHSRRRRREALIAERIAAIGFYMTLALMAWFQAYGVYATIRDFLGGK